MKDRHRYPLHQAAKDRNENFIRELLRDAIDVNQMDGDGRTPLHYAVVIESDRPLSLGSFQSKRPLSTSYSKFFQRSAMKTSESRTITNSLLQSVAQNAIKSPISIFDMSKSSYPVFESEYTPREESDAFHCLQTILVNYRHVNVNIQDLNGRTPCHAVAKFNSPDCLDLIAQRVESVNMNIRDAHGRTPLHLAAKSDSLSFLCSLFTRDIDFDLNIQDKNGQTPIHLAALLHTSDFLQALLVRSENVDVNIQDKDGCTRPSFSSAERAHGVACIQFLNIAQTSVSVFKIRMVRVPSP